MQVELPYKGGELSLVLMLPGRTDQFLAGGLEQLEQRIDSNTWDRLLGWVSSVSWKMTIILQVFRLAVT